MKTTSRIPQKVKEAYKIKNNAKEVIINNPSFINIEKDDMFDVERSESCIRIRNSKVNICPLAFF